MMLLCTPSVSTCLFVLFFFFNDTATTEIYTLSLHDALPISHRPGALLIPAHAHGRRCRPPAPSDTPFLPPCCWRSEEHTSELQSQSNLVCRLLLEKKKQSHALHHRRLRDRSPNQSESARIRA